MDPVTAIGLIASIVGLVAEISDLAATLYSYSDADGKIQTTFLDLKRKLPILNYLVMKIGETLNRAEMLGIAAPEQEALRETLAESHKCLTELHSIMSGLAPKNGEGVFKKLKNVLDNPKRVKNITKLTEKLSEHIVALTNYQLWSYMGRTDVYTVGKSFI